MKMTTTVSSRHFFEHLLRARLAPSTFLQNLTNLDARKCDSRACAGNALAPLSSMSGELEGPGFFSV